MDGQAVKEILQEVYRRLMASYGPQHWWPAQEPFEVIVGAILTQSAAWNNVEKAIANLKSAGVLTVQAIGGLPLDRLARLVYPSGYYNAKTKKLKAFCQWLGQNFDNDLDRLFSGEVDHLRRQLLSVHGIGEETADSIILYAAGKPVFVIDAYTRRIMSRLGLTPDNNSYQAWQNLFMHHLSADARLFNEYHALLVRLGKEVCRRRPLCERCCLSDCCYHSSSL